MDYVNQFSAAVLAGGRSSRMGQDKAALAFGKQTLLTHQLQKLEALGAGDLMISGWKEPAATARLIPDETPHQGPLGGICACLRAAKYDTVLFLSVDVPLIPAETLRSLLRAHDGGVTLLTVGEKCEPLIAVYDRSVLPEAEAVLRSENRAVKRLLERVSVCGVPYTGDPDLLLNCNTPAEFAEAKKKGLL